MIAMNGSKKIVGFLLIAGFVGTMQGDAKGQAPTANSEMAIISNGNLLAADSQRLSFQASLTDSFGAPLPGTLVDLTFTVWDVANNVMLDGPIVMNNVDMLDGIVDVQIPVLVGVFDGRAIALGLSVNGGAEMTPRISLTTVPYALRVDRVSSDELDDKIELGNTSQDGVLSLLSSNGTTTVEIKGEANSLTGGMVSVSTAAGAPSIKLQGETHNITVTGRDGQAAVLLSGSLTSGAGRVSVYGANGLTRTGLFEGKSLATGTGARLTLSTNSGSMRAQLEGDRGDVGFLTLRDGITRTVEVDGGTNNLGSLLRLKTPTNVETVLLQSSEVGSDGGQLILSQFNGTDTVILDAEESGGGGVMELRNSNGIRTIEIDADESNDGVLRVSDTSGSTRLEMLSDLGSTSRGAAFQLYNGSNERTILIDADEDTVFDSPAIRMYSNNGTGLTTAVVIDADSGSSSHGAAITLYNDAGTRTVVIDADETDNASAIRLYDSAGVQTIVLDSAYSGNGRVITGVLQLTGGSDISEQFDIASPLGQAEPGMVVSIDVNKPGKLIVSGSAYDHTVAGVISGAGGVNPGFLMGQTGSIANGAIPVALTGRVWTKCDATTARITPGTLLTTSARVGHAMAATELNRARGAIIGKAMTGLDSGTGLVLVLIQPQ